MPVLAGGQSWRLATAGGDNNVRIWMIHPNIPSPSALAAASGVKPNPPRSEYIATLARHTGVVNVVRFSPHGDMLASAGDDGNVLFWVRQDPSRQPFGEAQFSASAETDGVIDKESWRVRLMTRATTLELYDLAWSPDGDYVAVGGTDFCVRVIRVSDGSIVRSISDHQHYVQGIAWDPLQMYLATQSSDRHMHVYELQQGKTTVSTQLLSRHTRSEMRCRAVSEALPSSQTAPASNAPLQDSSVTIPPIKAPKPTPVASSAQPDQVQKLYGDDRCTSFFRRLDFSPDGALLATPAGLFPSSSDEHEKATTASTSATYIYGRANFSRANTPIAALPGHKSTVVVVRFSPILYGLRPTSLNTERGDPLHVAGKDHDKSMSTSASVPVSVIGLPYRMVYAVATQESVWIYDTQQAGPLCCFSNLHYASFTDLTWSPDGQSLMMSSSDGYCSLAVFDYHELGRPYLYGKQPSLHPIPSRAPEPSAPIPAPAPQTAHPANSPAEPMKEEKEAPSTSSEPKKKRRVALTYEGPLS